LKTTIPLYLDFYNFYNFLGGCCIGKEPIVEKVGVEVAAVDRWAESPACVIIHEVKVRELGEFGLIKLLADIVDEGKDSRSTSWQRLVIGIGDDAAAWRGAARVQLATTDSLIEGVHFSLDITTWEELGWKVLAVNLSDIAAMGGLPEYALVSLALPGELDVESISNLYRGMVRLANEFDVAIAGGNISSAEKVMITVTVLGSVGSETMLRRSTAMPGEEVVVTGYPGLSIAGLEMLRQKLGFSPEDYQLLRKAHLQPVPRIKEAQVLLHEGVRTAIDISDGVIADLRHICEASKVSAVIREGWLPVHPVLEKHFPGDCKEMVLGGGEDYELLFTASSEVVARVKANLGCPVTVIGEVTTGEPGKVRLINAKGDSIPWRYDGWEHFKSQL